MQLKRLEDDSIISKDGRIIVYSVPRFLAEIANGDCCFICGAKPGAKAFNQEHVIPGWVLRRTGLQSGNIALPNNAAIMYGRYTIPCCSECNTQMSQIFEDPISNAFENGWEGVTEFVRKDGGRLLWRWLVLIFLKSHLKHRELRWHLNTNLGDIRIADTYDWTTLHHVHCVARSFHTGAAIESRVYGSLFVCSASDAEGGDQFDFSNALFGDAIMIRIGRVMLFAVMNDSAIVLQALMDLIKNIAGPLSRLQGRELMAKFCHWNRSFEPRPEYVSSIDLLTGEYVIEALVPREARFFEEPRIGEYGRILHFFVREILEHTGADPQVLQDVLEGRYSFLFKEDGTFLAPGAPMPPASSPGSVG